MYIKIAYNRSDTVEYGWIRLNTIEYVWIRLETVEYGRKRYEGGKVAVQFRLSVKIGIIIYFPVVNN
jgi:hypothetical protein